MWNHLPHIQPSQAEKIKDFWKIELACHLIYYNGEYIMEALQPDYERTQKSSSTKENLLHFFLPVTIRRDF
jgi:hypothetical protein